MPFIWNELFCTYFSLLLLFRFTMAFLLPLFFHYLHHFMRSHFGFISCSVHFGWCFVSIACNFIYQVKVWSTHNNLFAPNEFIVCIISQTLSYKQYFKMAKIFAFVFTWHLFFFLGNGAPLFICTLASK